MVAALYSSRIDGTKEFRRGGTTFGWSTIEAVHRSDLYRAQQGISRRVPGLKYSHVVRDSWTRLNVLPAKIMQVCYDHNALTIAPSIVFSTSLIIFFLHLFYSNPI